MRRHTVLAAGLAATAVLAGCGGGGGGNASKFSGPQKDVAKTIDDLQGAARSGDVTKICTDLFTPRLVTRIARTTGGKSCQTRVGQQLARKNETITARRIQVVGPAAVAIVTEQNGKLTRLAFRKLGGQWRVDGITAAS
jgi:hypothetical protein